MQLTIEVDTAALFQAIDRLGDEATRVLDLVAKETATAIQRDARDRLRRQTHGTGATADAITVIPSSAPGGGYVVVSGDMGSRAANLPIWLEFGTKHMTPRPYLLAAARLEEGSYLRRVEVGMQEAIDRVGLGA